MTTIKDIERWITFAKQGNYKYIISVCDTYDWEDYPVYCKDEYELKIKYPEFNGVNMQRVNEIIMIDDKDVIHDLILDSEGNVR